MSNVNIFRYRPKYMKADLFHTIARDLRLDGEFAQGEEGMVLHNKRQILTWSQPKAKFGGLLFYLDRDRSLAEPAQKLMRVDSIKEYMSEFLERSHLMPVQGKHDVSVKLVAKATEAVMETGEKGEATRVPMRVDVSSHVQLDGLPVMGPRAKVRAAFGDGEVPLFMHIGLWETVDVYKTGELIPKDRLHKVIDDRVRRRERQIELRVRDITLAYWAREYRGGADVLEPYYFVEIEHLGPDQKQDEEGSGPRQVLQFLAYI
jgi:hypothetical protein